MSVKNKRKNKLNKKKKIKLIRYITIYVFLMLLLSGLLFSVTSDNRRTENTVSLTGNIQELKVNYNGSKNPVDIHLKINNQLFVLVWNSSSSYSNAVQELKEETTVTVEFYESVSWKGERFNRIIDLRSDSNVYYDVDHFNRANTFALAVAVILFIFFSIIFTFFFVIYIISIKY